MGHYRSTTQLKVGNNMTVVLKEITSAVTTEQNFTLTEPLSDSQVVQLIKNAVILPTANFDTKFIRMFLQNPLILANNSSFNYTKAYLLQPTDFILTALSSVADEEGRELSYIVLPLAGTLFTDKNQFLVLLFSQLEAQNCIAKAYGIDLSVIKNLLPRTFSNVKFIYMP